MQKGGRTQSQHVSHGLSWRRAGQLKEIFAEYKVLSERTQMSTGPVLLLTLQRDGPVGKNRGPASDLSGFSELRTGLKGLAHASDQSWQMVGVVGATPKAAVLVTLKPKTL